MLFLHGLESGPTGSKVQLMSAQGLQVVAPDQRMSLRRLDRENSAVRQLMRLGELRLTVALGLLGALAAPFAPAALGLLVLALVIALARKRRWTARALEASRGACTRIAVEALVANEVDVVVGSSWGGAVASELLRGGHWRGPTVLLAPATQKVQLLVDPQGWEALKDSLQGAPGPVHIVHDPDDDVVSIAGSRALEGGSVRLLSLRAGGHRLLHFVEDGRLAALVRSLA